MVFTGRYVKRDSARIEYKRRDLEASGPFTLARIPFDQISAHRLFMKLRHSREECWVQPHLR